MNNGPFCSGELGGRLCTKVGVTGEAEGANINSSAGRSGGWQRLLEEPARDLLTASPGPGSPLYRAVMNNMQSSQKASQTWKRATHFLLRWLSGLDWVQLRSLCPRQSGGHTLVREF